MKIDRVRLFPIATARTTQELNLGTAAVAHLAAAARVRDYPCDNTGPRLYIDDVVAAPVRYQAGYLHVPKGPGLGLEVDEARVEALSGAAQWTFGVDLAGVLDRTPSTRPSRASE
jgi:muconate cycloisomerase